MICSSELQNAYIKLYDALRQYIWDIQEVRLIADLEVSIYDTFPDLDKIYLNLSKLDRQTKDAQDEDDNLKSCFQDLYDILNSEDSELYAKIPMVTEVIRNENSKI